MKGAPENLFERDERGRCWLLAVAAPREVSAVLCALGSGAPPGLWSLLATPSGLDVVETGVGKSSAAGGVARVLDPSRHCGVLSIGIGGALPGSACAIGDVVCAEASVFADEGVLTPDGFLGCAAMGFGPFGGGRDGIAHDRRVVEALSPFSDHAGVIACVSMCSGTEGAADRVVAGTGAIAEAMEGAGVALSAHRIDPALLTGELRVISNTTGDRQGQQWDLEGALTKLTSVLGRLAGGGR